jgi:hypothetical protein
MGRPTVAEKNEDETPIRCFFPSCFRQLQRLSVEGEAFLQIEYVEIIVCERELHKLVSFPSTIPGGLCWSKQALCAYSCFAMEDA